MLRNLTLLFLLLRPLPRLSVVRIVGMINNLNANFPPGVSEYINIASVAQLNLEIMQHGCIFGVAGEHAYYAKVRIFLWLPVVLGGALCLVYGARLSFWRLRPSASLPWASARDRSLRFQDQLCNVGCHAFNMLYVSAGCPPGCVASHPLLRAGTRR